MHDLIQVRLPLSGILLKFDPKTQRLMLVEVFDLTKASLFYGATADVFGGPNEVIRPSFGNLYKLFGITYPGKPHRELEAFILQYPVSLHVKPHSILTRDVRSSSLFLMTSTTMMRSKIMQI